VELIKPLRSEALTERNNRKKEGHKWKEREDMVEGRPNEKDTGR
jgi:hypothetical protein